MRLNFVSIRMGWIFWLLQVAIFSSECQAFFLGVTAEVFSHAGNGSTLRDATFSEGSPGILFGTQILFDLNSVFSLGPFINNYPKVYDKGYSTPIGLIFFGGVLRVENRPQSRLYLDIMAGTTLPVPQGNTLPYGLGFEFGLRFSLSRFELRPHIGLKGPILSGYSNMEYGGGITFGVR